MENNKDDTTETTSHSPSDSSMLSSTCDDSSSITSSTSSVDDDGSSPPSSPPRALPPAASRVPALKFASKLQLIQQQPSSSPNVTSGRGHEQHPPADSSRTATLGIELISTAFPLMNTDQADVLEEQCAINLGVDPERLKYFALVEVPNLQALPPNCQRVALEVAGSNFSLQAVEDLLADNKRLKDTLQNGDDNGGQIAKLIQENESLRRRLDSSEALRTKGQQALFELKQEFESLHRELTFQALNAPQ